MPEAKRDGYDGRPTELWKFACWSIPGMFFPIIAVWLMSAYVGNHLTMAAMAADGGVLTIATSITVDALSRLLPTGGKWAFLKEWAVAWSVTVLLVASVFYGLRYARRPTDPVFFVELTFAILAGAIVLAMLSRALPKGDK